MEYVEIDLKTALVVFGAMLSLVILAGINYQFVHTITGMSMSPTIEDGDRFVCVPTGMYEEGDIVMFIPPYSSENLEGVDTVVHRIVEETEYGYKTRGDNNTVDDPSLIQYGDILCEALYWR